MGFHTRECLGCGLSLLGTAAVVQANRWLSCGVAISPDDTVTEGTYDGYGELNGVHCIDVFSEPWTPEAAAEHRPPEILPVSVWHKSCWIVAGCPRTFQGDSPYAADQGWFFDEDRYKVPDPLQVRS